jgi:hypothetical protein
MRTFYIPPDSNVWHVVIEDLKVTPPSTHLNIFIDVMKPGPDSIGYTGPDGDVVQTETTDTTHQTIDIAGPFHGELGCPRTWRVRVQSPTDNAPANVSGTIVLSVETGTHPITFDDPLNIAKSDHAAAVPNIHSHGNGNFIYPGTLDMRFQWDTDFLDFFHWNTFGKCLVKLLKPNGLTAAEDEGYSSHAPVPPSKKLRLKYKVTPADVALQGLWTMQITNNHTAKITGFKPVYASSSFTHTCG